MRNTSYSRIIGALLIAAALLAGCATGGAPTAAPTTESVPTQEQSQQNTQTDANPGSTAYPLVEETPTAYPSPQQ